VLLAVGLMIGESGTPAGTLEGMDEERADQLRIRLVQRASGLDPAENLAALEEIAALPGHPDLVVLPEAFARDFGQPGSDLSAFAEPLDGPFAQRLRALSSSTGSAWLAGMFETADDASRPLNTLLLADGERLAAYRKIHLYDSFGYQESDTVSPGAVEPVVVDVRGFPIGLMTCYDLRFPELARALAERGAEVVVVPAAWVAGKRKVEHWRTLLRARAIENTVWVVAVGQPGPRYTGHSLVVAPDGDVVAEADVDEVVIDARIDRAAVEDVRRTNPSLANRRM
jgi:predicted amidohydrolase